MNTCYAIISTPRSGSSALSGVVHTLGISMGDRLLPPMEQNPKGFYEDMEFLEHHANMYGNIPYLMDGLEPGAPSSPNPVYASLIRRRCIKPKWGLKDPRMVFLVQEFKQYLMNCKLKIISTSRPINLSAKSMSKVIKVDYRRATEIIGRYEAARLDTLAWAAEVGIESLVVPYNDLIDNTKDTVKVIAEFCEVTDDAYIARATSVVDVSLRNNK